MKQVYRYSVNALLVVLLTAGSLAAVAATNYYRWIDERGNTIHSDRPPPAGVDYEVVRTGASFKDSGASAEDTTESATEDGAAEANYLSRSQKNPELCESAKGNLDALTNSDRVTMRNAKGEVHVLTAEEIKVSIKTTRGQIDAFCE